MDNRNDDSSHDQRRHPIQGDLLTTYTQYHDLPTTTTDNNQGYIQPQNNQSNTATAFEQLNCHTASEDVDEDDLSSICISDINPKDADISDMPQCLESIFDPLGNSRPLLQGDPRSSVTKNINKTEAIQSISSSQFSSPSFRKIPKNSVLQPIQNDRFSQKNARDSTMSMNTQSSSNLRIQHPKPSLLEDEMKVTNQPNMYSQLQVITPHQRHFNEFEIRHQIAKFRRALRHSKSSQKRLQEWDKYMGLRQNHSRKLTKSSQSREFLLSCYPSDSAKIPFDITPHSK